MFTVKALNPPAPTVHVSGSIILNSTIVEVDDTLAIPMNPHGNPRRDAVVLRYRPEAVEYEEPPYVLALVQGVPAPKPESPALTRLDTLLAEIEVDYGFLTIQQRNIHHRHIQALPTFVSLDNFKLICLDVDGTLRQYQSEILLPNVRNRIHEIKQAGIDVAIITNQGGVGLRYWQETGKFGEPEKLPSELMIHAGLKRLVLALDIPDAPIFRCYAYQSKKTGEWSPTPPGQEDNVYWDKEYRKPSPRMIQDAIDLFGAKPSNTLMVGDAEEDEQAAAAAGCHFIWAKDFFEWESQKEGQHEQA